MSISIGGIASGLQSTLGSVGGLLGGSGSISGGPTIPRSNAVPSNILPNLSATSDALNCFAQQQFSGKLQAFMVNYVISVSSIYSVYNR